MRPGAACAWPPAPAQTRNARGIQHPSVMRPPPPPRTTPPCFGGAPRQCARRMAHASRSARLGVHAHQPTVFWGAVASKWRARRIIISQSCRARLGVRAHRLFVARPGEVEHPVQAFPSSIFLDKIRCDIGKCQSTWTASKKMETPGLRLQALSGHPGQVTVLLGPAPTLGDAVEARWLQRVTAATTAGYWVAVCVTIAVIRWSTATTATQ
jgi:hypothetical protein